MASYREPGVYMNVLGKASNPTLTAPQMIPCIIGTAADKKVTSVAVKRSSQAYDVLTGIADVADIVSVGFKPNQSYFTKGTSADYTVAVDSVSSEMRLTWTENGSAKIVTGSDYYVTFYKSMDLPSQGVVTLYQSDIGNLESILGPYLFKDESNATQINNLALCVYKALENGAPAVYAIATEAATEAAYSQALKSASFIDPIWRIVPADTPYSMTDGTEVLGFKAIHLAVDNHVRSCSSYTEKKERSTIYGYTSTASDLDSFKNYAQNKNYFRITNIYPGKCDISIPNNDLVVENLGPQFICAAYAGYEASIDGYIPKTRGKLKGIYRLKNTDVTRTEMNSLAEAGIMVLTQPNGVDSEVIVRHQLTTDTQTAEVAVGLNENSIVATRDYLTKTFRAVCEPYIGGTVISSDLITRIKGSLDSKISALINTGYILDGNVNKIEQDADSPDTVFVSLSVAVPHPCNKIDITMFVE